MQRIDLPDASVDRIFCFGVLQHTPEPERSFRSLVPFLRSGGEIVVDVYRRSWRSLFAGRYYLRPLTRRIPPDRLLRIVQAYVTIMSPLIRLAHRAVGRQARALSTLLAIADYRDVLPLNDTKLSALSVLDTFDQLSPTYDTPQRIEQVHEWLRDAGLVRTEVNLGYNGIEARGRAP